MTLRVGIAAMPYTAAGVALVREAERLGVDSVWVPEFWAGDALTPLAYLAARTSTIRLATGIVQLGARTPAMLTMSALSLQSLSDGRFVLGIGTSGPQVMEGWHGIRFDRPVRRTRETIEIIRMIAAGERLAHDGEIYQLPLPDSEGRAIRSMMPSAHIPIYVASLGPANLHLTGELADGWIGNSFFPESASVFFDPIREGAAAAGRDFADLDLTVSVGVEFTDDVDAAARRHADGYAFTFGAMGSQTTNFYNNAFERQGFGDDVRAVQQLWLAGDRDAARRRVPAAIGLGTNLLGTADMIRERLRLYRAAGVTTLRAQLHGDPTTDLERQIDDLGRLLDLVADVNREPTNCEPIPHAAVDHHQVELPSHSSKGNNHD
jgi:F420-dependent oxidoreductase-like protein